MQAQLSKRPLQPGFTALLKTQLQDRPLFAGIATRMVAEVPLTGVGLGSFNILLNDYARKYHLGNRLPFDNALNWYIHQFAELGLLGSMGWVLWIIVFIRTLLRPPATGGAALPAGILRCLLVAFGMASLVGVHAQNPQALLTFWTYTFWLFTLVNQPSAVARAEETGQQTSSHDNNSYDRLSPRSPSLSWQLWAAIMGIGGVYIVILGYRSGEVLRVPYRATMADWNYTYGFYDWEQAPDVGAFRWTRQKAVTVIPVQGPWLCSTVWVHHPDVSTRPVRLQVWIDQQLASDLWIQDTRPLRRCFPLPDNRTRTAVTIEVNRTWRPLDYNSGDPRDLGVALTRWRFTPSPQEEQVTQ
jgi:hypothetical protein